MVVISQRTGPRVKCTVCKTEAHTKCLSELGEKEQLTCRPTFREAQARQYREKATVLHHWVRRKSEKGKCKQCGKVGTAFHISMVNTLS